MAPSAASTVTSAPRSMKKERTARVDGKRGDARAQADLPRDPLEVKYRDFFWTYTEEPHRTRRLEIIKAHPEVTKLCGPEPLTKYVVLLVVSIQIFCAYLLRNTPFFSPSFWLLAYVVGATANQNLFLAIHEISHNLAFRSPTANRLLAILANLPIGIPYSASFRPYHLTHHKSLGVDGLDTDLPTALEAMFLDSILGKAFFCTFQILFYALRPMAVYRVPFTWVSALNVATQLSFDAVILRTLGVQSMLYFVLSSFLAGSLHPLAGHFIAEHYVYSTVTPAQADPANGIPVPETYSYYGPLNFLTYNVGLHNEHHDFPAVPWTRLHKLHDIAREFYADLPHHTSWTYVLWRFIFDESVGIRCRVKRKEGGRLVGQGVQKQKPTEGWREDELES
ncbi:fatty acid desaturase-domain-containing protein [Ustulina deusta]|nr:fatty acid desaturase-domain-containing protein [Ustulina deusta]KAI3333594.1 fatty acid desaturase-domain-containing protein [Ustulina deusta]